MARAGTIVERINDFTYEAGTMKLPAKRISNQYKNKNMRVVSNKKKPRKSAHKLQLSSAQGQRTTSRSKALLHNHYDVSFRSTLSPIRAIPSC
jgi:hypothetical protein